MKNPIIFGAAMLALGIVIGWMGKSAPDSGKADTAAASSDRSTASVAPRSPSSSAADSAPPGKVSNRPANPEKPEPGMPTPEQMDEARKVQSQMGKRIIEQQRQKFEKQIERLDESLSLSPNQKAKLTAWLDERLKGFGDADFSDPAFAEDLMGEFKLLNDEELQAQLEGTLTPEQQAALNDYQNRERAGKVDALALKSLSNLQGIIQFEEGQRDEVYKILSANAEESLNSESNTPDFSSMFTEGMGIEMDPYDLGIQQALTDTMSAHSNLADGVEPKNLAKIMRRIIDERIDVKVEMLRPVLNDKQLESYRTELQTKGLGVYGSVLDGMDGMDRGTDE